jgi:hypothetical protein
LVQIRAIEVIHIVEDGIDRYRRAPGVQVDFRRSIQHHLVYELAGAT